MQPNEFFSQILYAIELNTLDPRSELEKQFILILVQFLEIFF